MRIDNGERHGKGTAFDKQGDKVFEGTWDNNIPSFGSSFQKNNTNHVVVKYRGERKHGRPDGEGEWFTTCGVLLYKGTFKDAFLCGKGTIYDRETGAKKYEGDCKKDMPNGRGTIYSSTDGSIKYVGEMQNGRAHGWGIPYKAGKRITLGDDYKDDENLFQQFENSIVVYQGGCKNGKRCGRGTQYTRTYDKKEIKLYEGEWLDGERNGQGSSYNRYGSSSFVNYSGGWKDGFKDGKGTSYDACGNVKYEGEYLDGHPRGEGKYYNNGAVWLEGHFVREFLTGHGTIYNKKTGVKEYEGECVKDKPCGRGTSFWPNGQKKTVGTWDGKLVIIDASFTSEGQKLEHISNDAKYPNWYTEHRSDGTIKYQGQKLIGVRHGQGTSYDTDSTALYCGEWKSDVRHGRGTSFFEFGKYEGEWVNDVLHHGFAITKDGQVTSMFAGKNDNVAEENKSVLDD